MHVPLVRARRGVSLRKAGKLTCGTQTHIHADANKRIHIAKRTVYITVIRLYQQRLTRFAARYFRKYILTSSTLGQAKWCKHSAASVARHPGTSVKLKYSSAALCSQAHRYPPGCHTPADKLNAPAKAFRMNPSLSHRRHLVFAPCYVCIFFIPPAGQGRQIGQLPAHWSGRAGQARS